MIIGEAQTAVKAAERTLLVQGLSPERRKHENVRFEEAKKRADEAWKVYEPIPQTPEEEELWKKFVPAWDEWWKAHLEFVRLSGEYEKSPTEESHAKIVVQTLDVNSKAFSNAAVFLNKLIDLNKKLAEHTAKTADNAANVQEALALGLGLFSTILSLLLAVFITRGVNKSLKKIASELSAGAIQTADASGQVASSSEALAQGASEQASSIEETSASVEEMGSMTRQNAENSAKAKEMATSAMKSSERGSESMAMMIKAIDDIKKSSDSTAKIVKTIDEIAFQTNLLALNAAVEAARAGEAGKGFAVVAEEVRSLAQRSAEAAKTTSSLIEESVRNANSGVEISKRTAESLNEISVSARQVNELLGEIAAASNQQAQGISQIGIAINEIEKVTQSNAAGAEEAASASEELSAQAEEMKRIVRDLLLIVGGAASSAPAQENAPLKKQPAAHASGSSVRSQPAKSAPQERTAVATHGTSKPVLAPPKKGVSPQEAIPLDDSDFKDF